MSCIKMSRNLKMQDYSKTWKLSKHGTELGCIHINARFSNYQQYTTIKETIHNPWSCLHKNNQINRVLRKANNIKAFLQMNIYQCLWKTKQLFRKLWQEYQWSCISIIRDYDTAINIHDLGMIQRRAVRFLTGDYNQRHDHITPSTEAGPARM